MLCREAAVPLLTSFRDDRAKNFIFCVAGAGACSRVDSEGGGDFRVVVRGGPHSDAQRHEPDVSVLGEEQL